MRTADGRICRDVYKRQVVLQYLQNDPVFVLRQLDIFPYKLGFKLQFILVLLQVRVNRFAKGQTQIAYKDIEHIGPCIRNAVNRILGSRPGINMAALLKLENALLEIEIPHKRKLGHDTDKL